MATLTSPYPATERRFATTAHHYYIPSTYRAYRLLWLLFIAAPIIAGVDKFFNRLTDWNLYLSPWALLVTGNLTVRQIMMIAGAVEIAAGLIVAFKPRIGGFIIGCWMIGIIVNLLSIPAYFDIVLRDLGLCVAAFALSRLSVEFEHYRRHEARL
jgi:hypothetical protein